MTQLIVKWRTQMYTYEAAGMLEADVVNACGTTSMGETPIQPYTNC